MKPCHGMCWPRWPHWWFVLLNAECCSLQRTLSWTRWGPSFKTSSGFCFYWSLQSGASHARFISFFAKISSMRYVLASPHAFAADGTAKHVRIEVLDVLPRYVLGIQMPISGTCLLLMLHGWNKLCGHSASVCLSAYGCFVLRLSTLWLCVLL